MKFQFLASQCFNNCCLSSKLFQQFNGGGHPKAASATAKVADESEASVLLRRLVEELIEKGLDKQLTVGDFMQSPGE